MLVGTEGMRGRMWQVILLCERGRQTASSRVDFGNAFVPKMTNCVNHCAALCRLTGEFLTGEIERLIQFGVEKTSVFEKSGT